MNSMAPKSLIWPWFGGKLSGSLRTTGFYDCASSAKLIVFWCNSIFFHLVDLRWLFLAISTKLVIQNSPKVKTGVLLPFSWNSISLTSNLLAWYHKIFTRMKQSQKTLNLSQVLLSYFTCKCIPNIFRSRQSSTV